MLGLCKTHFAEQTCTCTDEDCQHDQGACPKNVHSARSSGLCKGCLDAKESKRICNCTNEDCQHESGACAEKVQKKCGGMCKECWKARQGREVCMLGKERNGAQEPSPTARPHTLHTSLVALRVRTRTKEKARHGSARIATSRPGTAWAASARRTSTS